MCAWGCLDDATNEYCRLSESTALESLRKFYCTVEAVYGQWYLRSPNLADLYKLLHKASHWGFPSMLGSLDCMHWKWENCPSSWACQFTGHKKKKKKIHCCARGRGLIQQMDMACLFWSHWIQQWYQHFSSFSIIQWCGTWSAPHVEYIVNGNQYHLGYYLADGIYPR